MTYKFDPAKLRELHEAAANVPWEQAAPGSKIIFLDHPEQDDVSIIAECDWSNDAALIVALRNAVPAILAMADENAALKAEVARLREANGILEDGLQEVGDDYPGSSCQEWCQQQVRAARAALAGGDHD